MKLYELTDQYNQLLEMADCDIPEDVLRDTLESISQEFDEKADSLACLIKDLDAEANAIRLEEVQLASRRKSRQKTADKLRKYLSDEMLRLGKSGFESARNKVSFRKSKSVSFLWDEKDIVDWAMVHRDDFIIYAPPTISKAKLFEILKNGGEIPGVEICENQNIQIK